MTKLFKVFVNHLPTETKFKDLEKYLFTRFKKFLLFKSKNRGKNRSSHAIVTVFRKRDFQRLLNEPFKVSNQLCFVSAFISEQERECSINDK